MAGDNSLDSVTASEATQCRSRPYDDSGSLRRVAPRDDGDKQPCSRGAFRVRAIHYSTPRIREGAGNAGRQPHPWPACNKKAGGSHHRFSRDSPAFPARWFYGLYVISPGTGFVAPVIGAMRKHRRQFDTSAGVSGPHDFAIRLVLFVGMNHHAAIRDGHRIPASRVVTIARNAPLL